MKIDSRFAEDLGIAMGGCLRDQLRFTMREAARAADVSLPLFDFMNMSAIREFKACWCAFMQGVALWTCIETEPALLENEKLMRKFPYYMASYAEEVLASKVFAGLTEEQRKRYESAQRKFLRMALDRTIMTHDFANAFLEFWHGDKYSKISDKTRTATAKQVTLSSGIFKRLFEVSLNHSDAVRRVAQ